MLDELTPDQWAKIKRGWVPVAGHLYVNPADHIDWWRVLAVNADGQVLEWVDCLHGCYTPEDGEWPEDAVPCFWGDHATTDGLLRTARAMWRDESLHVVPTDTGFALCVVRPRVNGERWHYVWDGESWARPPAGRSLKVQFQSEPAALLAAILAAPGAQ